MPLTGRGRPFGKIGLGPLSWYFSGSPDASSEDHANGAKVSEPHKIKSHEQAAIEALRVDVQFLEKLRRYGAPWRGVQERLKDDLPDDLPNLDKIAFDLVPRAMDVVFGKQEIAWKTEKRLSKSGSGYTTWIVTIREGV